MLLCLAVRGGGGGCGPQGGEGEEYGDQGDDVGVHAWEVDGVFEDREDCWREFFWVSKDIQSLRSGGGGSSLVGLVLCLPGMIIV